MLREKSQDQKLPTLKMLREENNRLTKLQTVQRDEFNTRREYERELRTVCSRACLKNKNCTKHMFYFPFS